MTSGLPADLIRAEIAALPDYNAGLALDRFRALYGIDCIAKLDSNENPLGPAPGAVTAIREAAAGVARYPDAGNGGLREQIAAGCGVGPERVIVGTGSEDLIGALFRAVLRPGDHVVTICPSFGLHEFGALACGAHVTKVAFAADWSWPLAGLAGAMAAPTRVLILSSPSNPAGPAMTRAEFRALLAATPPDTLIAFDEAYLEYVDPAARFDAPAILAECAQPWIVLRTLSKAYGLAGVRVGYGIVSDAALAGALMKTRNPFGVNALAVAAAAAALADPAHLARVTGLAASERARVADGLRAKGYSCAPSETNFIFFDTGGPAAAFAENLRHKGILIKAWQEEPYRGWARVTIGDAGENDAFLAALPRR
jgi:histidinol-phosphate aminotransferase